MQDQDREVIVNYAGARHGPWKKRYGEATLLSIVRTEAMSHFGVADSTDGGNQVVFRLYHGGDRLDNLDTMVGEIGHGEGVLALRLIREVIAG
jgi:hypothetical protein